MRVVTVANGVCRYVFVDPEASFRIAGDTGRIRLMIALIDSGGITGLG
jgi:hypothetical protein